MHIPTSKTSEQYYKNTFNYYSWTSKKNFFYYVLVEQINVITVQKGFLKILQLEVRQKRLQWYQKRFLSNHSDVHNFLVISISHYHLYDFFFLISIWNIKSYRFLQPLAILIIQYQVLYAAYYSGNIGAILFDRNAGYNMPLCYARNLKGYFII